MNNIIVTTTNNIEDRKIIEYKGIVFGEVVNGVDFIKDFAASISNVFGGRSGSYENEFVSARESALEELKKRALSIGANAVVGVKFDYETLGQNGSNMLMVTVSGTAVIIT